MSLSRRGFLGLLATGAVGACVAAKLPTAWLPEPVRRLAACEFMNKHVNAFLAAQGKHYPQMPEELHAGPALYEAYESELTLNRRFASGYNPRHGDMSTNLAFKGVPLFERGEGWAFTVVGKRNWEQRGHDAVKVDFVTGRSTPVVWNPDTKQEMPYDAIDA